MTQAYAYAMASCAVELQWPKGNSDYKTRQQNYNMISATENIISACIIKSITDFDIGNYGQIIDN